MDYQLAATNNFASTLAQQIFRKQFLKLPKDNIPFTKENGRVTIGALVTVTRVGLQKFLEH